ncbi:hypothetical protein [Noviherbaspirillum aridicola]|uniref:Uncharacterized protein n=1 Tax=Noviherbaspirillum aridicola TaxID=2849687 RepID=A0ABQ4QAX6_9BURK|nr:hypothetical protein [Noviherbaspirillum aridicola]GIZ53960.1 hypothetical protein NCCP691_39740 [Noviherbaspirillum aridicola]
MSDQATPPSRPSSDTIPTPAAQEGTELRPAGPYVGRPLDGSQYLDVVEEQNYADRRPSAEEQRPRFSYLHPQAPQKTGDAPPKP